MLSSESSSERGDSGATSRSNSQRLPDRFVPGGVVYLDDERCVIHRVHNHRVGYVVGLDTVPDRTSAERLRGKTLTVPASELPGLDDDTFFYFDIIEMAVRTTSGDDLGRIEEILSTGGNDVYIVRGSGKDILIPAVRNTSWRLLSSAAS